MEVLFSIINGALCFDVTNIITIEEAWGRVEVEQTQSPLKETWPNTIFNGDVVIVNGLEGHFKVKNLHFF